MIWDIPIGVIMRIGPIRFYFWVWSPSPVHYIYPPMDIKDSPTILLKDIKETKREVELDLDFSIVLEVMFQATSKACKGLEISFKVII